MKLQLRFFASVREKLAVSSEVLECPADIKTAEDVRNLLRQRGEVWSQVLAPERALRMAYNQVMVNGAVGVFDGGELAFFPPVTGG